MFLGRGNNHQPVHNELCTDHLILAERLPHGIFSSDGDHNDSVCDTSGLESQQNGRTAGRAARGDWNTRCSEDQRRTTALAGFFSYCALESTLILWSSSYLVGAKGISAERAAAYAALFCSGITLGRFLAGFVTEKLGDHKMIRLGTTILLAGCAAVLLPIPSDTAALAGLVVMGIGCAPVYPSIIHATPANFGEKNSQAIIGIQMASAYVGSTFMPPVFGLIANHISITLLPVYVLIFIVLMFFMVEKTFRLVR